MNRTKKVFIRLEKRVNKSIIRSEKWVVNQLFVQKNGLDSCFFVGKSVFLQRKFVPDKYHVYHAIKYGDYNIGREGPLLTLPNYMQFLLDLEPEEIILDPIDTDGINRLAKELLE